MNMSYDSSNLTTPDIKWLGVRPSDLDRFNIPEQCRLPMTDEDIKTGKRLVRRRCRHRAFVIRHMRDCSTPACTNAAFQQSAESSAAASNTAMQHLATHWSSLFER
jgi:DNA topoisomerase VI subunit A